VSVCSMTFLQNSLEDIALSQRGTPALGHFVTALSKHFVVDQQNPRLDWSKDKSKMRCINDHELKSSDLIKSRTTPQEYTKRKAYTTCFRKLQQLQQSASNPDQAGPSRQPTGGNEHDQMNVDDDHFLPPPSVWTPAPNPQPE
ncbi:Unknown protein, partial [Striga hermonthica]